MAPRENDWALLSLLVSRRIRKIILSRCNWLEVFTSGLIASHTQEWSKLKGTPSAEAMIGPQVHVDLAEFHRYARKRRWFYRLLHALMRVTRQHAFELDYQEIGDPQTLLRLTKFLGVAPDRSLTSRTTKQNASRLEARIENYDEVRAALEGTADEWMLE